MIPGGKHTAGPWRVINDSTIVGADYPSMAYIADVNLFRNNIEQQADGYANARLIVAAPELLDQLRDANRQLQYLTPEKFDDDDHEANWTRMLTNIENAIAKAEGIKP